MKSYVSSIKHDDLTILNIWRSDLKKFLSTEMLGDEEKTCDDI